MTLHLTLETQGPMDYRLSSVNPLSYSMERWTVIGFCFCMTSYKRLLKVLAQLRRLITPRGYKLQYLSKIYLTIQEIVFKLCKNRLNEEI